VVRLVRLLRLMKVVRLMKRLKEPKKRIVPEWKLPSKFSQPDEYMMSAMTAMVSIANHTASMSEEKRLQKLLVELRNEANSLGPVPQSRQMVLHWTHAQQKILDSIDSQPCPLKIEYLAARNMTTLVHSLMYEHTPLVQESVKLLMNLFTMRERLQQKAARAQVLKSRGDIASYQKAVKLMYELLFHIEIFELWGYDDDGRRGSLHPAANSNLRGPPIASARPMALVKSPRESDTVEVVEGSGASSQDRYSSHLFQVDQVLNIYRTCSQYSRMEDIHHTCFELIKQCSRAILLSARHDYLADEEYVPVTEMQDALSESGFVSSYRQIRLTFIFPADGDDSPPARRKRNIMQWINLLMVAFVREHSSNQAGMFRLLPMLVADMQKGVCGTAELIGMIVQNNWALVNVLPATFLKSVEQVLERRGGSELLKLMNSLVQVTGTPNHHVQHKVTMIMEGIRCPSCPLNDQGERMSVFGAFAHVCEKFLSGESKNEVFPDTDEGRVFETFITHAVDLTANLASGATHIVEAKIQSVVPPLRLLQLAMLDETPLRLRSACGKLFFAVVLEVAVSVPDINDSPLMWLWLMSLPSLIDKGCKCLKQAEMKQAGLNTQEFELESHLAIWFAFEIALPAITFFFSEYYTKDVHEEKEALAWTQELSAEEKTLLDLDIYRKCHAKYEDKEGSPGLVRLLQDLRDSANAAVTAASPGLRFESALSAHGVISVFCHGELDSPTTRPRVDSGTNRRLSRTDSKMEQKMSQARLLQQFHPSANEGGGGNDGFDQQLRPLSEYLLRLPKLKDLVEDDEFERIGILRQEAVVGKLIKHTRERIFTAGDHKQLPQEYVESTKWVMRLLRNMIETQWGFNVFSRQSAEGRHEEYDRAVKDTQDLLCELNAVDMCLDFFAKGIDKGVIMEAICLLLAMLFQEGGNTKVQRIMYTTLSDPNSSAHRFFFLQARHMFSTISRWYRAKSGAVEKTMAVIRRRSSMENAPPISAMDQTRRDAANSTLASEGIPQEVLLFVVLQLSCEGHYEPMQEVWRQLTSMAAEKTNVLSTALELLTTIIKLPVPSAQSTSHLIASFILESIQGPCRGNQEFFAVETNLIETMYKLLAASLDPDDPIELDEELTHTFLRIFKALLEGQIVETGQRSMIFERVLSVLHVHVLQDMVNPAALEILEGESHLDFEKRVQEQDRLLAEPMSALQVEALVLIKILCDYSPDLNNELTLHESVREKVKVSVLSMEVVWMGKLQRYFFDAPEVCWKIAKSVRERVVNEVNRDNQEMKLADFVKLSYFVKLELEHEAFLEAEFFGSMLPRQLRHGQFIKRCFEYGTWLTFVLNGAITVIALQALRWDTSLWSNWHGADADGGVLEYVSPLLEDTLFVLNIMHAVMAVVVLMFYAVIFFPIHFWETMKALDTLKQQQQLGEERGGALDEIDAAYKSHGRSKLWSCGMRVQSFIEVWRSSLMLYYTFYAVLAICANLPNLFFGPANVVFNSLMLFDIVIKLPVSRDVALSVIIPRKALGATMILGVIFLYFFAFLYFWIFHSHFNNDGENECDTFMVCFMVTAGMGLRAGGGLGEYLFEKDDPLANAVSWRWALDMSFFIIVIVLLLNLVFGIIIDQFAELRDKKKEREIDTTLKCFICDIRKEEFDHAGIDVFRNHIVFQHNM
jgi:hypothetical protein